jgi:hypothetical protein
MCSMYSRLECSWRLLLLLPQRHFGIKVVAPGAARPCVRFPIAVHGRRLRQAAFPCGTSLLPLWPRQDRPRRVKLQKMCQTGFPQTDVTTVSAPIVISSTIAADALTYRLTPLLSAGSHIYHLVINAKGGNGNPVHSAPASVTVKNPVPRKPILDRSAPSGHGDPLLARVNSMAARSAILFASS